ncbi:PKD domain-containing protein, partial [Acinetobacter baumannii]
MPAPNFTVSSLCVFDAANFTYTGTGTVTNYYWNFGNGLSSTAVNPTTVYTTAGTKNVMLTTV